MRAAGAGLLVPVVVSVVCGLVPPVAQAAPSHAVASQRSAKSTPKPKPVTKAKVTATTTSSVALSWKNPSFKGFTGVTIRRATGSTAPRTATSGTLVASLSRSHGSATAKGLKSGTRYAFAFFSRGAHKTYSKRVAVVATTKKPVLPPAKITALTATTTATSVTLGWTNPTTAGFTGVIVRRAAGTKAPASPTAGAPVADVAKPGRSVLDSGLASNAAYSYALFTHDGSGHDSAAVTKTVTTGPDTTPPGPVTDVQATPSDSQVVLSWTNPTDSDFAGVEIRRQQGSTAPTISTGTLVADTSSASARSFTDSSGLAVSTTYTYALFAYDTSNNVAPAATNTVMTHELTDVGGVTTSSHATSIQLSWTNPVDADYAGVEIVRTNGSTPPASLSGGVVVANLAKPTVTFSDTNLAPGAAYSYTLFAHDSTSDFAAGVSASAVSTLKTPGLAAVFGPGSGPGSITSDQVWSPTDAGEYDISGTFTVPVGVTLTIAPGTVVKGASGSLLEVRGTLTAGSLTGSTTTYFTSTNDNTHGTGAAGSSGSPQASDWGGIRADGAGSSLTLDKVSLGYSVYGVQESQGGLQVSGSTIHDTTLNGVLVNGVTAEPTISNDTFTNPASSSVGTAPAVEIESSTVSFADLNGNTGSGGQLPELLIGNGSTLGASDSSTGTFTGLPLTLQCTGAVPGLTIPLGVTATLAPGSVIKGVATSGCTSTDLEVRGDLEAVGGSGSSTITFTSANDSSVGGTTGSGNPSPKDWTGIRADGGSSVVDLNHVELDYADYGVQVHLGALTFRNSEAMSTAQSAVLATGGATDPWVSGDTFTDDVTAGGEPVVDLENSKIDLGKLGGNTGSGTQNRAIYIAGSSVLDKSSEASFAPPNLPLALSCANGGTGLTIPSGLTATLDVGSLVKSVGTSACVTDLDVAGSLVLNGTSGSPVTFTSYNDQSVGGNTGTGTAAVGDWTGILAASGSTVTGTGVAIDYATVGLHDTGGGVDLSGIIDQDQQALAIDSGNAAFRGSITHVSTGITACNWGGSCAVDATYTDWGTPSGPFPTGGNPLVCGAVLVSPWTEQSGVSDNAFGSANCDSSATPDLVALNAAGTLDDQITDESNRCDNNTGDPNACAALNTAQNCLANVQTTAANGYPAQVDTTETTAAGAANEFIGQGSSYLSDNASQNAGTMSAVNSFDADITTIATTVNGLGASFDDCDPE